MRMANPSSINIITTPPTLAQLKKTLASLTTASSILRGFAHRNKNQHRGTRWWGPFNMLSRSIRKLLPDLEGAIRRAEVLPSSSSAKRRKTDKDGKGVSVRQPELDRFVERAQWVHEIAVAKAYEAFTQLTADKQFAQLGLVLIGVLAQVEGAIVPFIQDAADASDVAVTKPADGGKQSEVPPSEVAPSLGVDIGDYDLGVAVTRDELDEDEDEDGDPNPPVEQSTSRYKKVKKMPLLEEWEQAQKVSKDRDHKKMKAGKEILVPITDKKTEPTETKNISKLKRKKTKKGGDEFDDLFSSLM